MKLPVPPKRSIWRREGGLACAALGLGAGLLAFAPVHAFAQAPAPNPNAVILEFAGNAALYSLNYERALTPRVGARVGVMYVQSNDDLNDNHFGGRLTLVPVVVHYLTGAGHNHLELGAGVVLGRGHWQFDSVPEGTHSHNGGGVFGTFTVGYRHQNPDGRNIFRVGLTPLFDLHGGIPWFGISYGRRW